jgi:hypothetical protein
MMLDNETLDANLNIFTNVQKLLLMIDMKNQIENRTRSHK